MKYRVPRAVPPQGFLLPCASILWKHILLPNRGYPHLVSQRCSVSLAACQPPQTLWAHLDSALMRGELKEGALLGLVPDLMSSVPMPFLSA